MISLPGIAKISTPSLILIRSVGTLTRNTSFYNEIQSEHFKPRWCALTRGLVCILTALLSSCVVSCSQCDIGFICSQFWSYLQKILWDPCFRCALLFKSGDRKTAAIPGNLVRPSLNPQSNGVDSGTTNRGGCFVYFQCKSRRLLLAFWLM